MCKIKYSLTFLPRFSELDIAHNNNAYIIIVLLQTIILTNSSPQIF